MRAMPLSFEDFQRQGVIDFSSSLDLLPQLVSQYQHQLQPEWQNSSSKETCCYVGAELTSVLDTRRSPSPPTSSSTLSSSQGGSHGGGGGASTDATGVAASGSGNPSVDSSAEKCEQLKMEDWEGVLLGSPSQEQSILRLIMGEIEDPSIGLNKLLQSATAESQEVEFNAGFGVVDQGFGFEPVNGVSLVDSIDPSLHGTSSDFPFLGHNARIGSLFNQNPNVNAAIATSAGNLLPGMFHHQQPPPPIEATEEKPQILNPQLVINQHQGQLGQNPAMVLPFSYAPLQEHNLFSPPPTKRLNPGPIGANSQTSKMVPFPDSRPELVLQRQPHQQQRQGLMRQKNMTDELAAQHLQQAIIHAICQAAELIETGNTALAQGILARLNHQFSLSIGKPHFRAAYYFKEALQLLLLHMNNTSTNPSTMSPSSLICKIGAFKSFSEISPILHFSIFTCNQAVLEACEGFERIHIIDFDIGFGGQWASLMQELALRNAGVPSLKITAFASPSSHDELELGLAVENLRVFANEVNIQFEFEILGLESLNFDSCSLPLRVSEKEVTAVNLPVGPFSNYPASLPVVLGFVKQISPKIVVSLDRGCDRIDLPFAHHVNHSIQFYSSLLDSLEAVNMNIDALQKIERFLVQPSIEKIILGRYRHPDRIGPWRSLFLQSGFSPFQFSNFAESQAECLVQRTPVRGFHVGKRQSSLVLCWKRKELVSASAWRC